MDPFICVPEREPEPDGWVVAWSFDPGTVSVFVLRPDQADALDTGAPNRIQGRLSGANEFLRQSLLGERKTAEARHLLIGWLCWAGIQVEFLPEDNERDVEDVFSVKIRDPVVDAIADVFPEEGFAELVFSLSPCPIPQTGASCCSLEGLSLG
jgi:hypothetical protein